ncbi:hypothetical protein BkAM31D_23885 [Halalkalibacter krulwichiae]|uniref:Translocation protein TolB n=1 Tax=Halalkalibacter krulwichiae TaxID=199441 RepID=A0A1X9MGQ7_9BACI|nr:hypothetical protein BkAM31D_23885 [Halalkalibacter krulwichiae]
MKKKFLFWTVFVLLGLAGCSTTSEPSYYTNPHVIEVEGTFDRIELGEYELVKIDDQVTIKTSDQEFVIEFPFKESAIQSVALSHDEQFIAFDVISEAGVKIYVVDRHSGEVTNLSDDIGYEYDYAGYEKPFGIAWAPNENMIAFVGGHHEGGAVVNMYHFDLEKAKQLKGVSQIHPDIYGVKWDRRAERVYYLVDSFEDRNMYEVFSTQLEYEDHPIYEKILYGGQIEVVAQLEKELYGTWFEENGE